MKLSITIVNYNQKYFPRLCIESIRNSRVNFEYEIIVCDNASNDESLEYLRSEAREGGIKLVEARENLGYGAGHNRAAKEARGKFILILNTDITLGTDTLQKMVDLMEKREDVGILGPKLMYHNGEIQASCRRDFGIMDLFVKRTFLKYIPPFSRRYQRYLMRDFSHNTTQEVDLITGAFMLMPMPVFKEVGGFDERYFLFMEDFDLCKKVRKAGYKVVYYPDAVAVHYHKRLSEGNFVALLFKKLSWVHLCSAIKYHWKWGG